jgi:hypothetical protein
MRLLLTLVMASLPGVALGQCPDVAAQRKATLEWVLARENPEGGFYALAKETDKDMKLTPSLRATSSAVRAIKYLGGEIPHKDKHAAFVLACFDPKTGAFVEQNGPPDVSVTCVGVMAAVELGIPKEKYAKAMDYLRENARTFEEIRIGAAAVEAWGVKECPFKLDVWLKAAKQHLSELPKDFPGASTCDGAAREYASVFAMMLRLGFKVGVNDSLLLDGQRSDGGWSKKGEDSSDLESTYRVMRALMLLKIKPKDLRALQKFVESHRNPDGGYAAKRGEKSSVSGVYYAAIISKWISRDGEMKLLPRESPR